MIHRRATWSRWASLLSIPALVGATLAFGGTPIAQAATVPAAFTDSPVAAVDDPTAVEALPDGRVVILDQNGKVRLYSPGVGLAPQPWLTLDVCGGGGTEMGLLGFSAGNDFAINGAVYIYYTAKVPGGCVNRVSEFRVVGAAIDPGSERILLDNIPGTLTDPGGNHNGGDIEVGQDGYLYVAIGDSGSDPRGDSGGAGNNDAAQDLSILSGKIVRITTGGGIPADNPFQGAGTTRCATSGVSQPTTVKCQEIFNYGLRNPYRFAFDPNEGATRFFINDVGQGTREEVDEGIKGANYGWNTREGACPKGSSPPCAGPPAGLTDPLTDYGRGGGCTYITGGAFIPNGVWPASYDGGYLFADGGCGKIFLRTRDGNVDYANPFASDLGQIADLAFIPDENGYSLYYTLNGQGQVRRISYTGALPPAPTVAGLRLQSTSPTRVYDTRNAIGTSKGLMRAATSRVVDVKAPAQTKAVLVNLTYAGARGLGFAQAWPPRTKRPATSVLNSSFGFETVANSAILPVTEDGRIIVSTAVTTDLVVDVLGYFTAATNVGGEFRALPPARLMDQRQPSGATLSSGAKNPYQRVGDHFDLTVGGQLGVPTGTQVGAVALIVTALQAGDGNGYATVWPTGATRPEASNVNTSGRGDVRANAVIVPVGTGGKVSLFAPGVESLLVDVVGWFTDETVAATGNGLFTVTPSARVVDTRGNVGFGRFGAAGVASLPLTGAVPANATAVVQNLTVAGTGAWGYVAAFPKPTVPAAVPEVSNVNFTGTGQTRAALAITSRPTSPPVDMAYYASTPTDLIVDLYGYFV